MKTLLYPALAVTLFACKPGAKTVPFTIEGTLTNGVAATVYIEEIGTNLAKPVVIDSAKVDKNGKFTLHPSVKQEGLFSLRADNQMYPFALVVNDAQKIALTADLSKQSDSYNVTGSAASEAIIGFNRKRRETGFAMSRAAMNYQSLSSPGAKDSLRGQNIDSLRYVQQSIFDSSAADFKRYTSSLIENTSSPAMVIYAHDLLQRFFEEFGSKGFSRAETAQLAAKAAARFPDNTALRDWQKSAGSTKAPDFALPDTSGKMVSLSSFRGKYVLVDFWASWCAPCRQENPNVVSAYARFKNKNFTILGVSLDQNKNAWLKAIHDDGLYWNQISDLKAWNNEAAALYGVQSIPYNFLIDPDGNIIAEDIRGPELVAALEKIK
jgi:peroxiredoxin